MTKETKRSERAVIVTTEHRGVFFGYAKPADIDKDVIPLKRARLCVYWSADMRGFMGLAALGPSAACRIGPVADIRVRKVTSVLEVSTEALARWEAAPWA